MCQNGLVDRAMRCDYGASRYRPLKFGLTVLAGELAPGNPTTRTKAAEVQVPGISPEVSLHPRPDLQHLQSPAPPDPPTDPFACSGPRPIGRGTLRPPPRDHWVGEGPPWLGEVNLSAPLALHQQCESRQRMLSKRVGNHHSTTGPEVSHPQKFCVRHLHTEKSGLE